MKIQIKKEVSETREIETPAFYRLDKSEVVALFDENNILCVYWSDDLTIIKSCDQKYFSDEKKLTDEKIISETEFMELYNKVHNSLSLEAKLVHA